MKEIFQGWGEGEKPCVKPKIGLDTEGLILRILGVFAEQTDETLDREVEKNQPRREEWVGLT